MDGAARRRRESFVREDVLPVSGGDISVSKTEMWRHNLSALTFLDRSREVDPTRVRRCCECVGTEVCVCVCLCVGRRARGRIAARAVERGLGLPVPCLSLRASPHAAPVVLSSASCRSRPLSADPHLICARATGIFSRLFDLPSIDPCRFLSASLASGQASEGGRMRYVCFSLQSDSSSDDRHSGAHLCAIFTGVDLELIVEQSTARWPRLSPGQSRAVR